jgi:hypothetical protein
MFKMSPSINKARKNILLGETPLRNKFPMKIENKKYIEEIGRTIYPL